MVWSLVPVLGAMSPAMSSKAAEHVGVHHGEVDGACAAHRPAHDAPVLAVRAHAEVRNHIRHHIFGEVVGGVAATAVDTFGVVVERASGIDEDQYRRIATVGGRECVGDAHRVAGPDPVGGGVELAADHHDRRQGRWWVGRVPGGWQVDEFAAVLEARCTVADLHGHHRALRGDLVPLLHRRDGHLIRLVGQRACGQLVPCRLDGREVSDPQVQCQRRADRRHSGSAETATPRLHHGPRASPRSTRLRRRPTARSRSTTHGARGRRRGPPMRCTSRWRPSPRPRTAPPTAATYSASAGCASRSPPPARCPRRSGP